MLIIKDITDREGNERTDGKYPLRKGCIGEMWLLEHGNPMMFAYEKDNQGNDKVGYLRSSIVEDYEVLTSKWYEGLVGLDAIKIIVYTMNSVYYFETV